MAENEDRALPSFHDGWLTSLTICGEDVRLGLKTVDDAAFELTLRSVDSLLADEFRLGNIICAVELWGAESDPQEYSAALERLFTAPGPEVAVQYHEAHAAVLKRKLIALANGAVKLVTVTPSYGCEFVALCRTAELTSLP